MRTELHFHLLPGVDDGPRDDAEALDMARLAVADGTGRIVATPHVKLVDLDELPARVEHLRARLQEAGIPLQVVAGGELSPQDIPSLNDQELESLAHGPRQQRWLLLEAPLANTAPDLQTAAAEARERGFGVLIAHPERSSSTQRWVLRDQVSRGSLLQVNASSLAGIHGPRAENEALAIIRSGLPFVVASDAHTPERPPLLTVASERLIAAGLPEATVRVAVDTGPGELLEHGLPATPRTKAVDHTAAPVATSSRANERLSSRETCIWE